MSVQALTMTYSKFSTKTRQAVPRPGQYLCVNAVCTYHDCLYSLQSRRFGHENSFGTSVTSWRSGFYKKMRHWHKLTPKDNFFLSGQPKNHLALSQKLAISPGDRLPNFPYSQPLLTCNSHRRKHDVILKVSWWAVPPPRARLDWHHA